MRQNMEELKATQEEAARKTAEMQGLIDALNESSYVIEYDLQGKILNVNNKYLNLFGISRESVIGSHHTDNMDLTQKQKKENDQFWEDLKNGKTKKQTTTITVDNKSFKFVETYTPIKNEEGDVVKVLKIANNISEFKDRKSVV